MNEYKMAAKIQRNVKKSEKKLAFSFFSSVFLRIFAANKT